MTNIFTRMKNKLGNKINVKIVPLYAGVGINIHHKGIIVNGHIGDNCIFHGQNCIGNKRYNNGHEAIPTIGSNVDFGYGSIIIGSIHIADDVIIGAGAVVTKDIDTIGETVVGVPAHKVSKI